MTRWIAVSLLWLAAAPALAEMQAEQHELDGRQVWIEVDGHIERLFAGRDASSRTEVLSAADIDIAAFASDADSAALIGQPALVLEVTGTHSCEERDARRYYVLTLAGPPRLEGPVTTCQDLTISIGPEVIMLESDPMSDEGEFWAWAPGKGFGTQIP